MSQRTTTAWQERLQKVFLANEPVLGSPLFPLPLRSNYARTEKVSSYVELDFLRFLEEYAARMGTRSVSEALRRLAIIGALAEGYEVESGWRDETLPPNSPGET